MYLDFFFFYFNFSLGEKSSLIYSGNLIKNEIIVKNLEFQPLQIPKKMAAKYHYIFDTFKHFWVARKPNFFDPSLAIGGAAISFFLNWNFGQKISLEINFVKKIDCTHFWNYVMSKRLVKMAKKWGLRLSWSLVKLAKWWEILDSRVFSHLIGLSKSKKSAFSVFWAKK